MYNEYNIKCNIFAIASRIQDAHDSAKKLNRFKS